MSIYYIGGVSASGKTLVTQILSDHNHPVIALDSLRNILAKAIVNDDMLNAAVERVAETTVRQLLACRASCIVEGGWLKPETAAQLRLEFGERFHPVYCGYPRASAGARLQALKQANAHWITHIPESEARDWLGDQISASAWYQEQCERHGFSFIDFSDFKLGGQALTVDYLTWKSAN